MPDVAFEAKLQSTRQLFSILRCIGFRPNAQVQISSDGLRVTVEDSRAMQGHAFVVKNLFDSFVFNAPKLEDDEDGDAALTGDDPDATLAFGISLAALLECLQIFVAEAARDKSYLSNAAAVSSTTAGAGASAGGADKAAAPAAEAAAEGGVVGEKEACRITYAGEGSRLCLALKDAAVDTTCELVTYEPEYHEDIPFAQDSLLVLKIIMKAGWLHDAIQELDGASVERLTLTAGPSHPYFSLSASGPLGSTIVEFSNERSTSLLETFNVPERVQNTYKFSLIRHALKAMAVASKVSIRCDEHGILSLQFMVESSAAAGKPSFVDFRFLPLARMGGGSDSEGDGDGDA